MQVTRTGERYQGSVTRVRDQVALPFTGVLELVAVLDRLTAPGEEPSPGDEGKGNAEERNA